MRYILESVTTYSFPEGDTTVGQCAYSINVRELYFQEVFAERGQHMWRKQESLNAAQSSFSFYMLLNTEQNLFITGWFTDFF